MTLTVHLQFQNTKSNLSTLCETAGKRFKRKLPVNKNQCHQPGGQEGRWEGGGWVVEVMEEWGKIPTGTKPTKTQAVLLNRSPINWNVTPDSSAVTSVVTPGGRVGRLPTGAVCLPHRVSRSIRYPGPPFKKKRKKMVRTKANAVRGVVPALQGAWVRQWNQSALYQYLPTGPGVQIHNGGEEVKGEGWGGGG